MKLTDRKGRRHIFSIRTPKKKHIEISKYDIRMFDALDTHGALTTKQLHLVSKTHKKNLQERVKNHYHGTTSGVYYFERPPIYHKSEEARHWNRVYENSDFARAELEKRGLLSPFTKRYDHRIHRLFGGTFGISMELLAPEHGLRYIRRHEILSRKGNPMELPLPHNEKLIPDDLCGVQYESGKKRYFAVEIDRGNEPIRRTTDGTSVGDKLEGYFRAIDEAKYRDEWGIGMMMVMIVTTAQLRITGKRGIFEYINETRPDLADAFIAKAYPQFHGDEWSVPGDLFRDVYDPWQRADGVIFDISKP